MTGQDVEKTEHCDEHEWVVAKLKEYDMVANELLYVCMDCPAWTARELNDEDFVRDANV